MRRCERAEGWGLLLALLLSTPGWGILGVEDLKPGMRGIGKTVFVGTKIETFPVEIVDILYASGFATDLVLVRVGGKKLEEIGGICAGMSGSPILVNNHLVGAIAFTTPMSDTRYGYVTPIKAMLKLLELEGPRLTPAEARGERGRFGRWSRTRPVLWWLFPDGQGTPIWSQAGRFLYDSSWLPKRGLNCWPVGTPVMVGGLRGRAFSLMARRLERLGLRPVQAGAQGQRKDSPPELQPGSAIGLSLASGDVALTALGTLTYVKDNAFLAFGHAFLQRGESSLYLVPAYIHQVVRSLDLPFKIGSPLGEPVGVVRQDRMVGVSGLLEKEADGLSLRLRVRDEDRPRGREFQVKVARDRELMPSIVGVCLLQAMDEVLDRVGEGTAEVEWTLQGEGLAQPIRWRDWVYHPQDVAAEAMGDLVAAVKVLEENEFCPVRLKKVEGRLAVRRERRTARIEGVQVKPERARPGESVTVRVSLRPYRGEPWEEALEVKVPEDCPPGEAMVVVQGREAGPPLLPPEEWPTWGRGGSGPRSLEELVERLPGEMRRCALRVGLAEAKPGLIGVWTWERLPKRWEVEDLLAPLEEPAVSERPVLRWWPSLRRVAQREMSLVVQGAAAERLWVLPSGDAP